MDGDGFLVLEAQPPLFLYGAGDPPLFREGAPGREIEPQVELVGPASYPDVVLLLETCVPDDPAAVEVAELGPTGWFASWCPEGGLVRVQAYGGQDRSFVEELIQGLSVRDTSEPSPGATAG